MIKRFLILAVLGVLFSGCSGEDEPKVEKGNQPVKEGAGETKTPPIANSDAP